LGGRPELKDRIEVKKAGKIGDDLEIYLKSSF